MARDAKEPGASKGARRKSFVAANASDDDFVPTLPAVGSAPIPAASDVNYFPSVQTGAPGLSQPAPPDRLVVPTRQSLTTDEVAALFVENDEMSSAEQIALLDSQMTLRDADLKAVREFVSRLREANPDVAVPLLAEVKARFHDIDDEVALLSLTHIPDGTPAPAIIEPPATVEPPVVEPTVTPVAPGVFDSIVIPVDNVVPTISPTAPSAGRLPVTSMTAGRHRGWSIVIGIAALFATLIPLTFAIFTPFGTPISGGAEAMLGVPGVIAIALVLVVSIPLVTMARTTSIRHALTWRAALQRVVGNAGGVVLAIAIAISMVGAILSITLNVGLAVATQVTEVPLITPFLAAITPNAHLSVLFAGLSVFLGFLIAALPRSLYRAKVLTLSGFMIAGPAVLLLTSVAVQFTSGTGTATGTTLVVTAAVVPIVLGLMTATESGSTTITRRDGAGASGAWLYIGLGLGIAFSVWTLVSSLGGAGSSTDVGGNVALHVTGGTDLITTAFGAVTIIVPTVLLTGMTGRAVLATFVSDDRAVAPAWLRWLLPLIPLGFLALDVTGILGDPAAALPGAMFLTVPLLVFAGTMAGASVAARRGVSGWAQIVNLIVSIVVTAAGAALLMWQVGPLQGLYQQLVAPLASSFGLGSDGALVVPVLLVAVSFVSSLIFCGAGMSRSTEGD